VAEEKNAEPRSRFAVDVCHQRKNLTVNELGSWRNLWHINGFR
jgi:hypothetical protein